MKQITKEELFNYSFSEMVNLITDIENNRIKLSKDILNYDIPLAVGFILHQHKDKASTTGYQDLERYLDKYEERTGLYKNEFKLDKNTVIEVVSKEIAIQNEKEFTGEFEYTDSQIGGYKPLKECPNWYYREL